MLDTPVTIIGAGLAGCEAAWQLAQRGIRVRLYEMKPQRRLPAHKLDTYAELVCSNSLRSDAKHTAMGVLHTELRELGSLVLGAADVCRVPAGDALAVDRVRFSEEMTARIARHPLIERIAEEVTALPPGPGLAVVASGPLTSEPLGAAIAEACGKGLYFYDSIAPIIAADSIDLSQVFFASRFGKGGGDDYLNLPLTREQYYAFVDEVAKGEKVSAHAFEEPRYFEGCLPIEVMVDRGRDCLAFGPMKPIGLVDPRTGRRPFAVVQLRPEDTAKTCWNMVGFQTRLTWPEQRRVFRMLPGLQNAEFVRLGQIHRNTYLEAPRLLGPDLALKTRPHLFFAGQITGVEGYVESAACGYLAALSVFARAEGRPFAPPPGTSAIGSLHRHLTGEAHAPGLPYVPSNSTFALFPPLDERVPKNERRGRLVERARQVFGQWLSSADGPRLPVPAHAVPSTGGAVRSASAQES